MCNAIRQQHREVTGGLGWLPVFLIGGFNLASRPRWAGRAYAQVHLGFLAGLALDAYRDVRRHRLQLAH
jgi:hypothetical protein